MYFAIKWPKAMASLALPGAIDAVREKKIIAVSLVESLVLGAPAPRPSGIALRCPCCAQALGSHSMATRATHASHPRSRRSTRPPAELVGAQRFVRELLAGDVGGEHEPAPGDREDRHAGLIVAVRSGIRRCAARLR